MKIFGYSLKRNYAPDGSCLRCPHCGGRELKEHVRDTIDWHPCEISIDCQECREMVGFWAYGYYDPCFMIHDRSLPALKDRIICKLRGVHTP